MTILKAPYWLGKHLSEEHKRKISESGIGLKRKPFTEEHKRRMSIACQNRIHPMLGKHHSEETKIKISEANKGRQNSLGRILSEETKKKMSKKHMGKHLSEETKKKMSKAHKNYSKEKKEMLSKIHREQLTGKNNPNWKGGITLLTKSIRNNFKYRQWRSDIFTRDDFTCQICGQIGGKLNAHHIKSFSSIIQKYEITTSEEALECEELWDTNNGITLCKKCHEGVKNIDSKE